MLLSIGFFVVVLAVIYIFYIQYIEKKKYENITYIEHIDKVRSFFEILKSKNDYITWVQRDELKSQFSETIKFFKGKTTYYKKEVSVKNFNEIVFDFDDYIANKNKRYIEKQKEKLAQYFDHIEGKKLDDQQRTAILTDEYSNLIIAGAGSGKTLTILGKVKYLIEHKNIKSEDILLLSFTKKTVEELNERLQKIGLTAYTRTFHKLGYEIIKNHQEIIPALTNENSLSNVVKEYLEKEIFNHPDAIKAYILYLACYMNIPEEPHKFNSLGEKLEVEKGIDLQTLKSKCEPELNKIEKAKLDTIQGERVKSLEELTIANFLYLNGIEYEYEKPYPFGVTMYRPDFYLPEYEIYIEHFGIDENNRAKWLTRFNEKKYIDEMTLKRETHKVNQTKLLETYSYYAKNHILLDKLREMLENENVIFKPRDTKSILEKVTNNDQNFGKELTNIIISFINLCKSRQLDYDAIIKLFADKNKAKNDFMLVRQDLFLQFALPILKKYDNTLVERNEIDFNDMINLANEIIKTYNPNYNYQYIIIDEYQDISYARFNLINEIRNQTRARLICVGDDWQSIYRFAGSDISLFSNFGNYVGEYEQLLIEQTYRNSQELIDITSRYIQKNTKQISKYPKSKKTLLANPVKFVYYSENNAEDILIEQIQDIKNKNGSMPILILGRHSFDINEFIKQSTNSKIKYYERSDKLVISGFEEIDIKYLTVHKSKGLEADNVIILNLKNHLLGFPNKMTDDPMLSLLLSDEEEFRFAEERRLFYVALTRTKGKVVLLIPNEASIFINELINDNNFLFTLNNSKSEKINCPYCQTGHLTVRQNSKNKSEFLGCSNFPVCNQTFDRLDILNENILCPNCESGFMVKKSGQFGNFLGCTNFPDCKKTIKLK